MPEDNGAKKSVKEILNELSEDGEYGSRWANDLMEAINREFKEFQAELEAQVKAVIDMAKDEAYRDGYKKGQADYALKNGICKSGL